MSWGNRNEQEDRVPCDPLEQGVRSGRGSRWARMEQKTFRPTALRQGLQMILSIQSARRTQAGQEFILFEVVEGLEKLLEELGIEG